MTQQEIKNQLDQCENEIVQSHSALVNSAYELGNDALSAAKTKTAATFAALLIVLFGLILLFTGGWNILFGIIVIIAGIAITHKVHESTASKQRMVNNAKDNLDSSIQRNNEI